MVYLGSLLTKHSAEGKYTMTERHSSVLCAALSISVICNMYLVCAALKLVILTFKLFTFVDDFVDSAAKVSFSYLNVYSNFLLVVKSCLHFPIVMIYNVRLRHLVVSTLVRWCPILQPQQPVDDDDVDEEEEAEEDGDDKEADQDPRGRNGDPRT